MLISDIIPALHISPASQPGRFTKHGLRVVANPGRGFQKKDPLVLYYEVYNLTFGTDDQTATEVNLDTAVDTNGDATNETTVPTTNGIAMSLLSSSRILKSF